MSIEYGIDDKPYLALGREIGDLLRLANQTAEEIVAEARSTAARIAQDAIREAESLRREAEATLHKARSEAEDVREVADAVLVRAREDARKLVQRGEAEAAVRRREAHAAVREAKREAGQLKERAQAEGRDLLHEIEVRIHKLSETEAMLRGRIKALQEHAPAREPAAVQDGASGED